MDRVPYTAKEEVEKLKKEVELYKDLLLSPTAKVDNFFVDGTPFQSIKICCHNLNRKNAMKIK